MQCTKFKLKLPLVSDTNLLQVLPAAVFLFPSFMVPPAFALNQRMSQKEATLILCLPYPGMGTFH